VKPVQPHDPDQISPPFSGGRLPLAELPDDTSRTENDVSAEFRPETGRTLKIAAAIAAGLLVFCFVAVKLVRMVEAHSLRKATTAAFDAPPPVDVVTARSAAAGQDLVLPGQTAAWFETTIYARVSGYVAKWSADIGDHVKKGQVLATIETPELDAELNASRAQLKASEAQVGARQAEAKFSKSTNERWRDSPKGVVSEQERESKKADYQIANARLYAANAQVALDRSKVEQYADLAEFKQVVAPFDGTITERRIDIGNLVTAGSTSSTTPLYRIAQTSPLRVFVDVPQSSAAELMKPGVPAEIRSTGPTAGVFEGNVSRSAESISAQARTMRVEVDLPNANHALLPGTYVNVAFKLQPIGVVEVPAAALVFRANGTQVARVAANGTISFQDVTIVRDNGSLVELGSGAAPGDRLVLNISSQIRPGQRVNVNDGGAAGR
jgi:RND family efflux transporter MFP subunit